MNKVIEIDDDLIKQAMQVTGATSEREAIERAVETYVAEHRKTQVPSRKSMFDLVGEVRLRDDYDYKALRAGDAAD